MEHKTLEQLHDLAETYADGPAGAKPMSKRERLQRWVSLLEQNPTRRLCTLSRTEFVPPGHREGLQRADTALSVAYEDPVLRAVGLKNATYGEGKRFFGLSDGQLHYVLCECFSGSTTLSRTAAQRVRLVMPGMIARTLEWLTRRRCDARAVRTR